MSTHGIMVTILRRQMNMIVDLDLIPILVLANEPENLLFLPIV
jgi:hypothetical protein